MAPVGGAPHGSSAGKGKGQGKTAASPTRSSYAQAAASASAASPVPRTPKQTRAPTSPGSLAVWIAANQAPSPEPAVGDQATETIKADLRNKCSKLDGIIANLKPFAQDDLDVSSLLELRSREREDIVRQLKVLKPLTVQLQQAAAGRDRAA